MGEWIKITVDDRIPLYNNYGVKTPINAQMSENGAWW